MSLTPNNYKDIFSSLEGQDLDNGFIFPHLSEFDSYGGFSESGFQSTPDMLDGLVTGFDSLGLVHSSESNSIMPSIASSDPHSLKNKSRKKKATIWLEKYDETTVVVGPIASQESFQALITIITEKSSEDFRSHYFRENDLCGFIYFTSEEGACRYKFILEGMEYGGQILKACCPSKYFSNPEDAYPNPMTMKQNKPNRNVTQQNEPTTTVVVRNLSFNLNQDAFTNFLTGLSIFPQEVQFHYDQNASFRGLAFVKFASTGQAAEALRRLQDRELSGRVMQVELKRRGSSSTSGGAGATGAGATSSIPSVSNSFNRLNSLQQQPVPKPNWSRSVSDPSRLNSHRNHSLNPHYGPNHLDFATAVAAAGGDVFPFSTSDENSSSPGLRAELNQFSQNSNFRAPRSQLRVQSAPVYSTPSNVQRQPQYNRYKTPPPSPPRCLKSLFPEGVPHVPKLLPGMEFN